MTRPCCRSSKRPPRPARRWLSSIEQRRATSRSCCRRRVRTLSLFYEQWLGKLPVSELERVSLLFDIGEIHAPRYARVKRLADIAVSALAVPVLLVTIPVVALGNRLGNRGPLFFAQARTGRNGEPFRMVKFRTMTPRGDGAGHCTTV